MFQKLTDVSSSTDAVDSVVLAVDWMQLVLCCSDSGLRRTDDRLQLLITESSNWRLWIWDDTSKLGSLFTFCEY